MLVSKGAWHNIANTAKVTMFAILCRPFGDLSRVWLCYIGPLVTLAVFGYVM